MQKATLETGKKKPHQTEPKKSCSVSEVLILTNLLNYNLVNLLKGFSLLECMNFIPSCSRLQPCKAEPPLITQVRGQMQFGFFYGWWEEVWVLLVSCFFVFYSCGITEANLHVLGSEGSPVLATKEQFLGMNYLNQEGGCMKLPSDAIKSFQPGRKCSNSLSLQFKNIT